MIYGLTADERGALRAGLHALPDTMPPRAVWHRIREQAEAEGLLRRPAARAPRWLAGAGLAAALALTALLVREQAGPTEPAFPVIPEQTADRSNPVDTLQALMVESRQLENDLRAMPAEPRVVRAGTQATILELEDRIAAIDYQLSDSVVRLSDADREIFWRERVRLMKLLVQLRYAQTQRAAL
jgi:hypothetical protein